MKYTQEAILSEAKPCQESARVAHSPALMELRLRHVGQAVQAGFPSPAQDLPCETFDLAMHIAPHPATTFTLKVRGDSMRDAGIPHGCLITVDRSITPQHGHIVVAIVDGEFTVKQLYMRHGCCKLLPANPDYPAIELNESQQLEVWGVVRASVIEHVSMHA